MACSIDDHESIIELGSASKKRELVNYFKQKSLAELESDASTISKNAGPYEVLLSVVEDRETLQSSAFKAYLSVALSLCLAVTTLLKKEVIANPDECIPSIIGCINYIQTVAVSTEDAEFQKATIKLLDCFCKLDSAEQTLTKYHYVLLLISNVLSEGGTIAEITKIKNMMNFFLEIDFNDENSRPLALQLARSCASNYFIRLEEKCGLLRRVMSEIDPKISEEALMLIKERLPSLDPKGPILKQLSHLLRQSWVASSGVIRLQIERYIDTLAESAILCDPLVSCRVRGLLFSICDDLKDLSVSNMKARLFEPRVFAYYSSSNYKVRKNCVQFLGYAFPLCDPDDPHSDYNLQLQSQYNQLVKSISEKHPDVRSAAIHSTVRVMCRFWETLPPECTTAGLMAFIKQSVVDSVPSVRAEAILGIGQLLSNPFTHQVVSASVLELVPAMHDKSPLVRQAMMNLVEKFMKIESTSPDVLQAVSNVILPRVTKESLQTWNLIVQRSSCGTECWHVDLGLGWLGRSLSVPKARSVSDQDVAGLSVQRKLVKTISGHLLGQLMQTAETCDLQEISAKVWHKHLWEFLEICPLATLSFVRDASLVVPRAELLKLLFSFWQKSLKEARTAYMILVETRTLLHQEDVDVVSVTAMDQKASEHHHRALLGFEMLIDLCKKMNQNNEDTANEITEAARKKILEMTISTDRLRPFFQEGSDLKGYRL
eukprot:GHVH01005041.1.p1 GENE.GHVH01005041.1~~GHVH01005041.1.p1  ORF type:complete len:715 (+),score=142.31 GHVH01005041.1:44-2188(+)